MQRKLRFLPTQFRTGILYRGVGYTGKVSNLSAISGLDSSGWVMSVPGLSFQRRLQTFIPMASYFVIPAQAGIQVFYLQAFTMALCPLFELGYGSEILKNWIPACAGMTM